jgi:hypothetical protein
MAEEAETKPYKKSGLKEWLQIALYVLPWAAVWLWLKGKNNFPDSFGHHNGSHGRAGVFDDYLNSPLLLHRPGFWEIALFVWMWLPVILVVGWLIWAGWYDFQTRRRDNRSKLSIFEHTDSPE